MLKNFKYLIFLLILSFGISSCNVQSSSISSSTTASTSSQVSSVGTISGITLSTEGSLIQFMGLTSQINISAAVVGTTSQPVVLEWFVNNVKSLTQSGTQFEFMPTSVGTYVINAKSGSVTSNSLTVSVDEPSFTAALITAASANSLEVTASAGVSFLISNNTVLSSSNYNIATSKYTLNLINPLIQGTTYTITMTRPGFKPYVTTYLYDTRTLKVSSLIYNSRRVVPNSDGVYTLVKPFDSSTLSYNLLLEQQNLEGQSVAVSILTDTPAGITVAPYQQTLTLQKGSTIDRSYNITRTSPVGIYTHNVLVNNKSLTVRVLLIDATPTIGFEEDASFVYGNAGTLNSGTGVYAHNTDLFAKVDNELVNAITPEANGSYIIYRPYNGPAKQFAFKLGADYFPIPTGFPDSGNPHVLLGVLSGPSGGTMLYGANIPNTFTSSIQFRSTLDDVLVFANVDSKTPIGTYTYNFSAGSFSVATVNKTITVIVREFAPKIEPILTYGGSELKPNSDGTYTLVKPLPGNSVVNTISLKVSYFESPFQFQGGSGLDTLYDPDTSDATDMPRFLLNYSVNYNGPLVGVANVNTKIAIELGALSEADNTVVALGTSTPAFNRFIGTGDFRTINITSNIANMGTLTSTSFPGIHTYTITIGTLTRALVLRVEEPTPKVNLGANSIRYGGESLGASTLAANVTLNAADGKYYVNGPDKFLSLQVLPFGMPTGTYPYTFTRTSPSGSFSSSTNFVFLELNDDPYDGTLSFPTAPDAGAEMVIAEVLTEEGEYKFTYNINGATRNISIVVLPDPQLRTENVLFNNIGLVKFNGQYYIERASSTRFLTAEVTPLNIKSNYKFTVSNEAVDANDVSVKQNIVLVEGKLQLELTLAGSSNANSNALTQIVYYLRLYEGDDLVGIVTQIKVNVQDQN
jgi:hypothetical protein